MGLILSKSICWYGIKGVITDNTNLLQGFVFTSGERVFYDGLEANVDPSTLQVSYFTADAQAQSITFNGPVTPSSHGSVTIVDSTGASFTYMADVRVPAGSSSNYTVSYTQSGDNMIIGHLGIGTDDQGATIFTDIGSVVKPSSVTLTLAGAGAVGYLEDRVQGLVGLIDDTGSWKLFADKPISDMSTIRAKYFKPGQLLNGISIVRTTHDHVIGRAVVTLQAIDAAGVIQAYTSFQDNVLGIRSVYNSYTVTVGTSTTTTVQTGVLKTFTYLTTSGLLDQRLDYLMQSTTNAAYSAPNPDSYIPTRVNADNQTLSEANDNASSSNWKWVVFWICIGTVLLIIIGWKLYSWVIKSPSSVDKELAETERLLNETQKELDTV